MEYPKRENLEKVLYEDLKKRLLEYHEGLFEAEKGEDEGDVLIKKLYLDPQEGCVPDEFIGEELLYAVKSKYYAFFSVVRDEVQKEYLEKKKIQRPWISIVIDPSYEDVTYVVMTFQAALLYEHQSKAWNFAFSSVPDLKKVMADSFYETRDRLNRYLIEGIRYVKEK